MKHNKVKTLPIDYKIDKELLRLISEANEKYCEYKINLKNLPFDSKNFLNSILSIESLKSNQIEGNKISKDKLYYLKYMPKNDDNLEIKNLKEAIEYSEEYIKNNKEINLSFLNKLHEILLNSIRGNEKESGKIRTIQNWIGQKGCDIENAIFVPPSPEEIPTLLDNLFKYMNDEYIDPIFVNLAISHFQIETIHPYRDGNGRLGRLLIPIQLAILTDDIPILFLSEVIELYKISYYKFLNESRKGNILEFIKFFLQCIIEQCNNYNLKLNKIKYIYEQDMKKIKELKRKSVYKIMPVIMKQVIFTKKEIVEETGVSRNIISKIIDELVKLNILEQDTTYMKKGYKYKDIYNIFIGT